MSIATTSTPLAAIARSIGSSAWRSLRVPRAAVQVEHRRERPRALRLIDPRHQLPPGAFLRNGTSVTRSSKRAAGS